MAPEMDQFYRSTMAIYKSIMEQFNPALENLVYLGNNYLRAFHALSEAAEVYFSAIQKIGEQALQSSTSQILGEILVQMSDTQRHLNSDLEVVVQTFHGDLLQHMEKNTKLDMQFIKDSRQHYEIEYRHRAANLEKRMSDLWRMERKRDKNVREMKESVNRLHAQMQTFVSESQRAAELEEKRRYRFLAEKHLLLSNTFLQFFGRARGVLQNRVLLWKEQSEASRSPSRAHSPGLLGSVLGPPYPSGRLTPTRLDMPQRPLGEFSSPRSRHGSGSYGPEPTEARSASQLEPERRSLPRTPSASSLYTGSTQRSRSNSFGERPGGSGGGGSGSGGARRVRALVSHSEGANHTLLRFSAGDVVEVLVPEAQNGWLYGKLEGSSTSGWFPEAYVKPLEEVPMNPKNALNPVTSMNPLNPVTSMNPLNPVTSMNPLNPMTSMNALNPVTSMNPMSPMNELPSRSYPLRGSHSLDDLLERPGNFAASVEYWDNTPISQIQSRGPSRAPSPTPTPGSRRSSMGSTGVASDVKVSPPPPSLSSTRGLSSGQGDQRPGNPPCFATKSSSGPSHPSLSLCTEGWDGLLSLGWRCGGGGGSICLRDWCLAGSTRKGLSSPPPQGRPDQGPGLEPGVGRLGERGDTSPYSHPRLVLGGGV
ncbi:PREDICTED: brain-specific angiogenesis inhibitor 1-associated protein 2-like protein 2 isoform X1 [Hipposideros armiger]|uniref:BAR/IMD domain-containing adapter protein 2-like 2 n=1 Tax=Hipposideros armiger TaxID=186990 RepID=A0A8B7T6J5_HIPAR|nr:PREDICTED: brain-specific angiogenesis inhibitor 1-associated protein 2-like protein 2 isoform X1 [Hipposideros armiger]